jgi:DNA-binding NarL/FixJ family response regulator
MNMARPRLLIADDHTLVQQGLSKLLEDDFDIVGFAENGRQLIEMTATVQPDVVLVDIAMPLLNGIDAARQIDKMSPRPKIVFVTVHSDPDYVTEAFRAGANGYILKRSAVSELISSIREVLKGYSYVTPLVAQHVVTALRDGFNDSRSITLTGRQRQVLQLVAEGHTAKGIAQLLNISVKTAEFHKASIMDKLALRSTAQLTRYAIDHGLIA